jgi:hypothetical protein
MSHSIWGRGVVETCPVYRLRINKLDYGDWDATFRVGRTAVGVGEASSPVAAVRAAAAQVRRLRKSGALKQLRTGG